MFEVSVLASGSSGNCFFIGSPKADILVDVGISTKQIVTRLNKIGKKIENIKGIFISHEHYDHVRGIETLSRKFNIPVFVNKGTLWNSYLDMGNVQLIETDDDFDFHGLKILPFSKSHDAGEPVGYSIRSKGKTISVMTDLGFGCGNCCESLKESDLVILETNHDVGMLKNSSYPNFLKKRIAGKKGHLSNYDAALMVLEHGKSNLQHVLLSHLSLNNNLPELALKTFNSIVGERSDLRKLKSWMTYREHPTKIIKI